MKKRANFVISLYLVEIQAGDRIIRMKEKGAFSMDKIISLLRRPARIVIMCSAAAYLLFMFLYSIGRMGGASGDVIAGGILFIIASLSLGGAYIFALVKKNDEAAKVIGAVFLGYIGVNALYGLLYGGNSYPDSAAATASYVFNLIANLCAVAVIGLLVARLFVKGLTSKSVLRTVEFSLVAIYATFRLVAICCSFGSYAFFQREYGFSVPWFDIMHDIADILILPAILIGYVVLFIPVEPKPVEEKQAEEQKQEEEKVPVEKEQVPVEEEKENDDKKEDGKNEEETNEKEI